MQQCGSAIRTMLQRPGGATGLIVQVAHPAIVEVLSDTAIDTLCLDVEHSPTDLASMHVVALAADAARMPLVVRVAANDPAAIGHALDAGAVGILVPRIRTPDEVARVVSAARYPPFGARGAGPGRASRYGAARDAYIKAAHDVVVAVQVETRDALENLDAILATEGLDLVVVGPNDLALSLGLAGGPDDEQLIRTIERIVDRASEAGVLTGVLAQSRPLAEHWRDRGVNLIISGTDLAALRAGVAGLTGARQS